MPLKHTTETFLLFLLGAAVALTGMALSLLPALPEGLAPWSVLFVVALLYPLVLGPLFRRNRADHFFRALHGLPAFMLLLWLALAAAAWRWPAVSGALAVYTWGWSIGAVLAGFLLLIFFCIQVVRRWLLRIVLLAAAFLPFAVGGVLAEQWGWNAEVATALRESAFVQRFVAMTGNSGALIASTNPSSEQNLEPSEDPAEEAYRQTLRAMERRRERIERRQGQASATPASVSPGSAAVPRSVASSSRSAPRVGQSSSMPSRLPSSGFGFGDVGLLLLAAYSGVLHQRVRRRKNGSV